MQPRSSELVQIALSEVSLEPIDEACCCLRLALVEFEGPFETDCAP